MDQILNPTEDDSSSSESYEETDFNLATPKDLTEWNKLLEMGMPGNDVVISDEQREKINNGQKNITIRIPAENVEIGTMNEVYEIISNGNN